jgi:pilus assembly protein CpaB
MRTIVLLLVTLGCGLVAALGSLQYLKKASAAAVVEKRRLLIARHDIAINERLSADNLTQTEWPRGQVPLGAVESVEEVQDKYACVRLYAGEPLLMGKTMGLDDSGALKVPAGFRVVSVKVTAESAVSNLIKPGDSVDVVAVVRKSQDNPISRSKTILESIQVFAINSEMARATDLKKPSETRTVSLLLNPEQVERLAMAADVGQVKLALRGIDDKAVAETAGCTLERVLGIHHNSPSKSASRLTATAAPVSADDVRWSMTVTSPNGTDRFRWVGSELFPQQEETAQPAPRRRLPPAPMSPRRMPEAEEPAPGGQGGETDEAAPAPRPTKPLAMANGGPR